MQARQTIVNHQSSIPYGITLEDIYGEVLSLKKKVYSLQKENEVLRSFRNEDNNKISTLNQEIRSLKKFQPKKNKKKDIEFKVEGSEQMSPFVEDKCLRNMGLSDRAIVVFTALRNERRKNRFTWPSYKMLGEEAYPNLPLSTSKSRARKAMKELIDRKVVTLKQNYRKDTKIYLNNEYYFQDKYLKTFKDKVCQNDTSTPLGTPQSPLLTRDLPVPENNKNTPQAHPPKLKKRSAVKASIGMPEVGTPVPPGEHTIHKEDTIQKNISLSGYIKKETFLENPLKERKEVFNEDLFLDIPLELKEQKIAEALAKDPATSKFFNRLGVCPVEQKQVKVNKKPEKLKIKRLKALEAEALMDFLSKCYQYPLLKEKRLDLFEGSNKVKARLKYYLAYIDNNDPFFESTDKTLNVKNIIYYTLELILHKYYDCLLDEEEKSRGYYSKNHVFSLKNYSTKGKIGIEYLFDRKRPNIDDFNRFKARMIMAALCKMEETQRDYIVQNLNEHILPQENYIEAYESLGDKVDFLKPLIKQEEEEKPEQYDPDDFSIMGVVKERFKAKTEVKEEDMDGFIMGMRKSEVLQKYKYEGKLMPKEVYSTLKASHPEIIDEIEGRKNVNKKRIIELFPSKNEEPKIAKTVNKSENCKQKTCASTGLEKETVNNYKQNCKQNGYMFTVSTETEESNKNKKTLQEIDLDWVKKEHQKLKKNVDDGKFGAKVMLNMFKNKHREVLDNVFD